MKLSTSGGSLARCQHRRLLNIMFSLARHGSRVEQHAYTGSSGELGLNLCTNLAHQGGLIG